MDTSDVTLDQMKSTLRFLAITNKYFGGTGVIVSHLNEWSQRWKPTETITILDIGTGGAEIPIGLAQWAKKKNLSISITAIDLIPDIAAIARENTSAVSNIRIEQADFFDLASSGKTFDYVTASLLLHHIPPARAIETITAMSRVARRGIIISDLHRTLWNYHLVKFLSYLIGNKIVRHDGPLSVQRAFRPDELEALAKEANLPFLKSQTEPWCRISLAGEKS